ncbi:hypothetical protein RB195_018866 [Necator americanus]|uniref:Uncharacterized protein n=1 Tax=Necator americanus TaxID=51031 RepID=A0ABR1CF74_NECAM
MQGCHESVLAQQKQGVHPLNPPASLGKHKTSIDVGFNHIEMPKQKIRSSCDNHRGQKISRRSRPRSPLPDNVDISTPLSSLASDHEALVTAAVNFVGWNGVVPMLPPCLQGRSRNDVILLVSDELDGMSEKRIFRILQGIDVLLLVIVAIVQILFCSRFSLLVC